MKPNKAQLRALLSVYNRGPILPYLTDDEISRGITAVPITYRQFRRGARYICHMNILMVKWCGMWLGIEPDGYTHS